MCIPIAIVLVFLFLWSKKEAGETLYGFSRMLIQLSAIGYFLVFIFETEHLWVVLAILTIMAFVSGWIALRSVKTHRIEFYKYALISISLGSGFTLLVVTQGVLDFSPWYAPRFLIPLAGMVLQSSMNSVSLAIERLMSDISKGMPYPIARSHALKAALIPITNLLFAVGLVALPGMMTGQILVGVSPLIAARYQIMVTSMLFAASGISATCFLLIVKSRLELFVQDTAQVVNKTKL